MAKITLPYIEKNIAKGRFYYRYRRDGHRLPLPCDPTSPKFMQEYTRIHESFERGDTGPTIKQGSIAALIRDYRMSPDFRQLSVASRRDYEHYLEDIHDKLGDYPAVALTRKVILAYRDDMAIKTITTSDGRKEQIATPSRANYALAVFRKVLSFGCDRGIISVNYALRPKRLKTGEHKPWTEKEITKFLEVANDRMKLAFLLAIYTGQRQGDILRMRWDQCVDDGISLTQGKTGVELWIPMHEQLKYALQNTERRADYILTSTTGLPYKSDYFKHEWRKETLKAGIDGFVFHGLRKTATGYLAEAGCSGEQIKAITGHKTDRMVSHYVAGAKQKERAKAAMRMMEENCPTPPHRRAQLIKNNL